MHLYRLGPLYTEARSVLAGDAFRFGAGFSIRRSTIWLTVAIGIIGVTIGYTRPRLKGSA